LVEERSDQDDSSQKRSREQQVGHLLCFDDAGSMEERNRSGYSGSQTRYSCDKTHMAPKKEKARILDAYGVFVV